MPPSPLCVYTRQRSLTGNDTRLPLPLVERVDIVGIRERPGAGTFQTIDIPRRAEIRIGELSRELEKNERVRTDLHPTAGKQTKTEALADAGISTSTAHRYEELTGGADARGEAAAKRAIEETLAKGRAERTPVSAKELRSAIKEAILAELGPAPERRARHWRITNRTPDARVTPLVTATLSASSLQSEHQARARARTVPML